MTELPAALRTLVKRYGTHVLDDADGLRATLDDFLDEGSASAGEVNLVVDAVRFGALERLETLLSQGADPSAATMDAAGALAQRRGGDADSAYWACAVLGYAADLLPGDLIPGTWVRPSSEAGSSATAASATSQSGGDQNSNAFGMSSQTSGEVLGDDNATYQPGRGSSVAPATSHRSGRGNSQAANQREPGADGKGSGGGRRYGVLAVAAATVIVVLAAGIVYLWVTRTDGTHAMRGAMQAGAHEVPVSEVLPENLFGHFGGNLKRALKPQCSHAYTTASHRAYDCPFKHSPFYLHLNNGDPLTAKNHLPKKVEQPPKNTIVTTQASSTGSFHAYYLTWTGNGNDGIRNTQDDVVTLTLYDVAEKHPGSATFLPNSAISHPLLKGAANSLLEDIGALHEEFPLPKAFAVGALRDFAQTFLSDQQMGGCVAGFRRFRGESEHDACVLNRADKTTVEFGYTQGLARAKRSYSSGRTYSWRAGTYSGQLAISRFGKTRRLFWYPENLIPGAWGLLSANAQDYTSNQLLSYFEQFRSHPIISPQ